MDWRENDVIRATAPIGTMGPALVPIAIRASPKALMGLGPKTSRVRTVNRHRNARATLRPGARAPLTQDASFPDAP